MDKGIKKTTIVMAAALLLCLGFLFAIFYGLVKQYGEDSAYNSASHLIELNQQGKQSISALLKKDQALAREMTDNIERGMIADESQLYTYMERCMRTWEVDNIYIYTAEGLCISPYGIVQNNGSASERALDTIKNKEIFHIIDSQMEYSMAVSTDVQVHGSTVIALSVVHDLDTLIENMGFEPFDNKGTAYLTRQNGVEICQSSGGDATPVYNLLSVFESGTLDNIKGDGKNIY